MTAEHSQYIQPQGLEAGLTDRPDPISDAELGPFVQEMHRLYRAMKQDQPAQPEAYQPGTEWAVYIEQRGHLYNAWLQGDLAAMAAQFRSFWRNDLGAIVKQYAGYQTLREDPAARERFVDLMAYDYMIWRHLLDADPQELAVPPVGNPWGYVLDDVMIAPKALRYHALMTQIRQITADRQRPVVAEIGAGYGGTAYYLLRGQDPLLYINFDLPETLVLCAYYLRRTLPQRRILLYEEGLRLTPQHLAEYDVLLLPNWMLPQLPDDSVDLFLNTFSLSEVPPPALKEYIGQIERVCRGYFLHNNMDRAGVVNLGYERTPASRYPVSPGRFKLLYKRYDMFQRLHYGRDGDYREFLYQRI